MSAATIHRIADVFDPLPQSSFSAEEKAAILREARKSIADGVGAHAPAEHQSAPVLPKPEDPVTRWRREADEQAARDRAELARDRREQRQRERQQRQSDRDATMAWQAHLESRFEMEREFLIEVIGTVVADITHRFQAKINKLEAELRELKT